MIITHLRPTDAKPRPESPLFPFGRVSAPPSRPYPGQNPGQNGLLCRVYAVTHQPICRASVPDPALVRLGAGGGGGERALACEAALAIWHVQQSGHLA